MRCPHAGAGLTRAALSGRCSQSAAHIAMHIERLFEAFPRSTFGLSTLVVGSLLLHPPIKIVETIAKSDKNILVFIFVILLVNEFSHGKVDIFNSRKDYIIIENSCNIHTLDVRALIMCEFCNLFIKLCNTYNYIFIYICII